jgi:hypothetical protein
MPQLSLLEQLTVGLAVWIPGSVEDDENAVPPAAVRRFYDEVLQVLQLPPQLLNLALDFNDAIELGYGNARRLRQSFGSELVVHQRVQLAGIVDQGVEGIAPVDP